MRISMSLYKRTWAIGSKSASIMQSTPSLEDFYLYHKIIQKTFIETLKMLDKNFKHFNCC